MLLEHAADVHGIGIREASVRQLVPLRPSFGVQSSEVPWIVLKD
jgi:hypothetical protein